MSNARTLAGLIDDTNTRIKIPSGYGLDFADYGVEDSNNATTVGSNLMDDYEEGTWTPLGNNVTFVSAQGNYLKIGNLVHVEGLAIFPTTSDTNNAKIQNFPFEIANYGGLAIGLEGFSGGQITILCEPSSYNVTFRESGTKTNADVSGVGFYFGGTYITS